MHPPEPLTIEGICKILGIDSPYTYWDKNADNCECQVKGEEYWCPERKEYVVAEKDWTCEACSFDYAGKVETFFGDVLLGKFKLSLIKKKNGTYELRPQVSRGWTSAAQELIQTINGYGLFYFSSVKEGIASGPYKSAKDFVLHHLGWVSAYYEVYEGGKASSHFHRWAFGR